MNKFLLFFLTGLCVILNGYQLQAQLPAGGSPQILNLDSLSPENQALLLQYQDSFKNDLADFLEIFDKTGKRQIDTSVYNMDRSSHVEVGLNFISRMLVNGRVIALSTNRGKAIIMNGVGFYPELAYFHKTGIYFGLNTTFYTDAIIAHATPVPAVSLSAGYGHTFFRRWFVGLAYTRTFNNYGSAESRKLLNNTISFATAIDIWKKLILSSALYVYWSSDHSKTLPADEKWSVQLDISLKKEFVIYKFLGAKEFTITPALNFYFANDNRTYISAIGIADVKNPTKRDTILKSQNVNDFFGFLNMEPAVNFDWRIRNVDIYLMPTLAIPFNVFYPVKEVRALNPKIYRFYVQAGAKYLFCVKKKPKGKKQMP